MLSQRMEQTHFITARGIQNGIHAYSTARAYRNVNLGDAHGKDKLAFVWMVTLIELIACTRGKNGVAEKLKEINVEKSLSPECAKVYRN